MSDHKRKGTEGAFWEKALSPKEMFPEYDQICEAYVTMAKEARYRPAAPGDTIGIIQLSDEEMASPEHLAKEAHEYAMSFIRGNFLRENSAFWIGRGDYDVKARMLADRAGGRKTAIKLLEMALADVKEVVDSSIPE